MDGRKGRGRLWAAMVAGPPDEVSNRGKGTSGGGNAWSMGAKGEVGGEASKG